MGAHGLVALLCAATGSDGHLSEAAPSLRELVLRGLSASDDKDALAALSAMTGDASAESGAGTELRLPSLLGTLLLVIQKERAILIE